MRHESNRAKQETNSDKNGAMLALSGLYKKIFRKRHEKNVKAEIDFIMNSCNAQYPLKDTLVSVWHPNKNNNCGHNSCAPNQGIVASNPYFTTGENNISINVLTDSHLKRIHLLTKVATLGNDKGQSWVPTGWKCTPVISQVEIPLQQSFDDAVDDRLSETRLEGLGGEV